MANPHDSQSQGFTRAFRLRLHEVGLPRCSFDLIKFGLEL